MDKIKHVLNPGKETDDEILYGSGRSDDPVHSGNLTSAAGQSSNAPGTTGGSAPSYDTSSTSPSFTGGAAAGPHSSNLANKLDPRVDSDRDGFGAFGSGHTRGTTGLGYGDTSSGDVSQPHHSNPLAADVNKPLPHTPASFTGSYPQGSASSTLPDRTVTRPGDFDSTPHSRVGGDTGLGGAGVPGASAAAYPYDQPGHGSHDPSLASPVDKPLPSQGPAPSSSTAGPHSSNLANKVDPRVDSDLDQSRTVGSTGASQSTYSTSEPVPSGAYPGNSGNNSGMGQQPLGGAQEDRPESGSSGIPSGISTSGLGYENTGSSGPIRSYQDMPAQTTMYADDPARAPDSGYMEHILDPRINTEPAPVVSQQPPISGTTYSGDSRPSGLPQQTQPYGDTSLDRSQPLGSSSQAGQYNPPSTTQYSESAHHGRDTALFAGGAAATGAALAGTHRSHDPSTEYSSASGPHGSNILNKLDSRVDSDRDGSRTFGAAPGTGSNEYGRDVGDRTYTQPSAGSTSGYYPTNTQSTSSATGPHNSNILNKLDPRVDSDRDGSRAVGVVPGMAGSQHRSDIGEGTYGGSLGGSATGHHPTSTESASPATGPHKSNILNKLDPRVDSDRDGSRTVSTAPGMAYGEHRTGVDDGIHGRQGDGSTTGHHHTSAAPIIVGAGAAAAASQYPYGDDHDRSRYNEPEAGEKKHGLFHRTDEQSTHPEDTHRYPGEKRDDKEHHGLLGGVLHRDKDKDVEAERERERARHAKEEQRLRAEQEKHLKEEKHHHHKEEKRHHHDEKHRHQEEKKHHKEEKKDDKDHHGLLGGLLHRDKDNEQEAEHRRQEEERLRQQEANKHEKEHHGLLGGLLHRDKDKEHDKHEPLDRPAHHDKPLTTHDTYPAAREHHEPNKLHKDPPPEIAAQMAAGGRGSDGHDPRNRTGDDGIVTEPHTGLPMNVGKYGSGAGGTDAGPQPGYHKH